MNNKGNPDDILVKFSDVTKQYGDLIVLDKLNLEIKKNEMVSIIGPSGSGKTTVLRVLMTLEKINQGIIHLDGEPLTHMPGKEDKLSYNLGKISFFCDIYNIGMSLKTVIEYDDYIYLIVSDKWKRNVKKNL